MICEFSWSRVQAEQWKLWLLHWQKVPVTDTVNLVCVTRSWYVSTLPILMSFWRLFLSVFPQGFAGGALAMVKWQIYGSSKCCHFLVVACGLLHDAHVHAHDAQQCYKSQATYVLEYWHETCTKLVQTPTTCVQVWFFYNLDTPSTKPTNSYVDPYNTDKL